MGFEQLAELKEQLAKEQQAKRAQAKPKSKPAKPVAKPPRAPRPEPRSGDARTAGARPAGARPDASRPDAPRHATARHADARPAPVVVKSKPVDPVVLTIGKLQKRFPKAFPKNPSPKVPLKIGIFEDLLAHAAELALSEIELRAAIKIWCRGSRCWTSLVEGAVRVDLSDLGAGRVSREDGARALKLEESRLARAASKAANVEKIV